MPTPGKVDINATINAWADIVIKIWHDRITVLKVYDKGYLDDSLLDEFLRNAGNDIQKVEFSFKLYGIFVDMGVGREISMGNSGDLGFSPTRKPKEWYSRKYYGQIMKLREILLERYSVAITYSLINTMTEPLDQRYANIMKAPAVTSLRTVVYRGKANERTAMNYARRRSKPGYWSGGKTWKNS